MNKTSQFRNQPLADFSLQSEREKLRAALDLVEQARAKKALFAAPLVNGATDKSGEIFTRFDPSDNRVEIGQTHYATVELAKRALDTLTNGLKSWRATPYQERADIIEQVGLKIKERASFFTALIIREAGKTWREADADVAEAIDFCLFYAEEMRRLGEPYLTQHVMGEENHYLYQPRGVVAVIAPWNFPLAIACGMAVAGLVTGNTVVLKPSEQTSIVTYELSKIILECGVPSDAYAFLPGRGEDVGRHLVDSPKTSMIAFTGSRPVGLEIIKSASQVHPGQAGIKRVVAELGGKNAIIVDEDADFDDAIRGTLYSAFGFAGQKCSACSRLIIVGSAYEPFLERLAAAASDLILGAAAEPSSFYGPVIDQESFTRISQIIEQASDLKLLVRGTLPEQLSGLGWYIPPTIFRDVPLSHSVWREEIFGPVLACARASTFNEALDIANDSDYGLTGGVFSRNPSNLELAKREFRVGNLYINRGITGALVCRQPFGGFKFSGIGSKAGGHDYLLQFMEPRVITENTMRRGFTPDLPS